MVGVGPRKLSVRNFQHTRKFWSRGTDYQLHMLWFHRPCGAVSLLIFFLSRQAHDVASPSMLTVSFKLTPGTQVGVSHILRACGVYLPNCKNCLEQSAVRRAISLSSEFSLTFVYFMTLIFRTYCSPAKFRHANYFANTNIVIKGENFAPQIATSWSTATVTLWHEGMYLPFSVLRHGVPLLHW